MIHLRRILATACLIVSGPLFAADTYQLDIKPQPLNTALQQFAKQSGLQIVYYGKIAEGHDAAGISGNLTADQALKRLLAGTDLQYETLDQYTVAISSTKKTSADASQVSDLRLVQTDQSQSEMKKVENSETPQSEKSPSSTSAEVEEDKTQEVVVTGTHIRGVAPDSSPLMIYDRRDIERSGVATTEQFIRLLPQNFANVDGRVSSISTNNEEASSNLSNGSSINLHGIGAASTLILMNGHRLPPTGLDGSLVDISVIPLSAIERVEIMTDGASAVYGADAVAGVVNFILKSDYEGLQTTLRYGDSNDGGGRDVGAALTVGRAWAGGSALFTYDYDDQQPIRSEQRDFITPLGGDAGLPSNIAPANRRHSFFTSAQQRLGARSKVFAEGFFTDREFDLFVIDPYVSTQSQGGVQAYGATVGVNYDLSHDWQAELIATYGRTSADALSDTILFGDPQPPAHFLTRSRLSSIDLRADGGVFTAPGGVARASLGLQGRREQFDDLTTAIVSAGTGFKRTSLSGYGELFVPLIGANNARSWAQRLELSLAARHDNYDDIDASTQPRIGLLWSPAAGVNLRAAYARSYRAPPLSQLSTAKAQYFVFPLEDSAAPDNQTNTLYLFGGNPDLEPESAHSFSAGVDYKAAQLPGLSLSLTYFDVDYQDRINSPPIAGSFFGIYAERATLARFMQFSPNVNDVQDLFDTIPGSNPLELEASEVEAIFDDRLQNVLLTHTQGLDFAGHYDFDTPRGQLELFLNAAYLLKSSVQASSSAPDISKLNIVFYPVDLRLRGGVAWTRHTLSASVFVDYADDYANNLFTPAEKISSWTCFSGQLSYRTDQNLINAILQGITATFSVQNLFNTDPPTVHAPPDASLLGYDPANATALGRFFSVSLTRQW